MTYAKQFISFPVDWGMLLCLRLHGRKLRRCAAPSLFTHVGVLNFREKVAGSSYQLKLQEKR